MLLSLSIQASRVKSSSFFTLWSTDHFLHFLLSLWSSGAQRSSGVYVWNQTISAYCQWKPRRLITKLIMCVFSSPPPKPLPLLMWCQSHGFQAPRAVNQNQILFLTTLNPPPCWWLAKALALALSTSISPWTLRTTYQRSDHICSIISWLQEGRCLALPQMKGSPLLITSVFFLSSLLSRAAPSLGEISLQYSSGEMQPFQSNYITLIARLETTIEALFPSYSTSSFPSWRPTC